MSLNHKLRSKGIGSSEIAQLLGISPWGGPHRLWRRKTGKEEDKPTKIMERGTYMEAAILDWYADKHNVQLEFPETKRHPDYHWVIDSVDAIVPGVCCVEAKTVHWSQHEKWSNGRIPIYYEIQCQWHCGVHGLPYCDVPFDNGTELDCRRVDFDKELFEKASEIARRFWSAYVMPGVEPPVDYDADTSRWLSKHREQRTDTIRTATDEEARLMLDYKGLKLQQKRIAAIEVRLKEAIGEDDGLKIAGTEMEITHRKTKKGNRILRSAKLVKG